MSPIALRAPRGFRRMGLQRRIMLYVTVGLAAMFGTLAVLGLGAIDEATHLVFQERLSTAYTTAGIIVRDFERVGADVIEAGREPEVLAAVSGPTSARGLLDHLARESRYPFFQVSGVWLLTATGELLGSAGFPDPDAATVTAARTLVASHAEPFAVAGAVGPIPGSIAFATVLVRVPGNTALVALIHTASINSADAFTPASYGSAPGATAPSFGGETAETYHLEVVQPDGRAVLGIGYDEVPGALSRHFPAIRGLMETGSAAALLHEAGHGETFERHVMAVVPLAGSPFFVVLEQPVDVALALPLRLRQELLLATVAGFLGALVVAWITTRHVVKPTEQLTGAARRMAGGDLASPVSVAADDEVGQLADSLEAMRQRLAAAYDSVERTNRELEGRVAERTERLGQVLRQTISAQEEERRRLARELHDETAQTIAALSIALDRARDEVAAGDAGSTAHIRDAKDLSTRLLADTRRLILGLRPTVLDDMGLLPALRWYGESHLGERGIEVSVTGTAPERRLPSHIEVALFRIVQEALSNVAKHAQARTAQVRLSHGSGILTISVTDDGRGFDVGDALGGRGSKESVGLLGMEERVRLLGGRLEIESLPGRGTVIKVEVPLNDGDA